MIAVLPIPRIRALSWRLLDEQHEIEEAGAYPGRCGLFCGFWHANADYRGIGLVGVDEAGAYGVGPSIAYSTVKVWMSDLETKKTGLTPNYLLCIAMSFSLVLISWAFGCLEWMNKIINFRLN
ncbi:MAG: hypothetical protein Q7T36_00200 [Fluviicoccus sp.]|uniref:hypothetical protein n=1 Tax=Fluviicoccus sp. TaxID=2003552 RepID=UPI002718D9B5|nr:hypothetical protein [Fluviicoccus sp.]MDO8328877.1 hypothetical protein [Fluviicoccus sp.]